MITAVDGTVDYRNYDNVLFVAQDGPADTTDRANSAGNRIRRFTWAHAWGTTFTTADVTPGNPSGRRNLGVIAMPQRWDATDIDGRRIHTTLSHEFGHNLGLGDHYVDSSVGSAISAREMGAWDLMAREGRFPQVCIVHRMMLGWVPEGWVESFDFSRRTAPIDQTFSLHPLEPGSPSSGRRSGIEIRIANGWNYYFEYRVAQPAQIGDRNLDENSVVPERMLCRLLILLHLRGPEFYVCPTTEMAILEAY